jgi:hypothetical protein
MSKKLLTNLALIGLALAVVVGVQAMRGANTVQASADKDCVCHAAGPDPTQYICIHPSDEAVTDNSNGGHLNEDSSHGPQHAPDFLCDTCADCNPQSSPSPSPSPSPSSSPK